MQQVDEPDAARSTVADGRERPGGLVEAFAGEIRKLEKLERRGDLASLRRLDVDAPSAPAFFRIVVKVARETGEATLRRYARFVQILALKPGALVPGGLGAVMAQANISERRVQKLLTARGPALAEQLRLIARRLANEGVLPYRDIGDLLLIEDEDGERAERVRMRIARDYWRTLDRADAHASCET